jgi:hypothetical protein
MPVKSGSEVEFAQDGDIAGLVVERVEDRITHEIGLKVISLCGALLQPPESLVVISQLGPCAYLEDAGYISNGPTGSPRVTFLDGLTGSAGTVRTVLVRQSN